MSILPTRAAVELHRVIHLEKWNSWEIIVGGTLTARYFLGVNKNPKPAAIHGPKAKAITAVITDRLPVVTNTTKLTIRIEELASDIYADWENFSCP